MSSCTPLKKKIGFFCSIYQYAKIVLGHKCIWSALAAFLRTTEEMPNSVMPILYRVYMGFVIPQTRGLGRGFSEALVGLELYVDFTSKRGFIEARSPVLFLWPLFCCGL